MTAALLVVAPGLASTVQDLGRVGGLRFGVPPGGALDRDAHRLANALIGAPLDRPALELRLMGPTLRAVDGPVRVALAGAKISATLTRADGSKTPLAAWRSATLQPGDTVAIGALRGSSTATLAVDPPIVAETAFGSASTFARGGFGGFRGRPLAAGDHLALSDAPAPSGPERSVPPPVAADGPTLVRLVAGPQAERFAPAAFDALAADDWRIGAASDRMGLRLEGPALAFAAGARADIVSDGVSTGAIQVPADGAPILLLADRQTTGGYAKIACAASADLPALGRMSPGGVVRFALASVEEAVAARRAAERAFEDRLAAVAPLAPDGAALLERLHSENLVTARVEPDA